MLVSDKKESTNNHNKKILFDLFTLVVSMIDLLDFRKAKRRNGHASRLSLLVNPYVFVMKCCIGIYNKLN